MNSLEWNHLSLLCCLFITRFNRRFVFVITACQLIFFWSLHLLLFLLNPDCGCTLPHCTRLCKSYCRNLHPWFGFLLSAKVIITPTHNGCGCTWRRWLTPQQAVHVACIPAPTACCQDFQLKTTQHSRTWECSFTVSHCDHHRGGRLLKAGTSFTTCNRRHFLCAFAAVLVYNCNRVSVY